MFDISPMKTFKDSVHGYISIPRCFVDNIINTELFQRLRNIEQTGMKVLYPDAKHDRFGHSLGVFYLGSKAVEALLTNFSNDKYWKISSDNKQALFWAKNKVLFLIACLLHDVGHVPFSHSLEGLVLRNSSEGKEMFRQIFCNRMNAAEKMNEHITEVGDIAPHEIMGAMLIMDCFREPIERIYDELIEQKYPLEEREDILYAEHYQSEGILDKNDLDDDICFVVRMITGVKYQGYEPEKQIRNCFIELLNGSNFDVDKLDYIVRDTQMSGISNINIDIERLLKAVCIVTKTKYIRHKFEKENCANCTVHHLQNYNGEPGKFRIRGNFKGVLKFEGETKVIMEPNSTFMSLFGTAKETKIRYIDEAAEFTSETKIYRNGNLITRINKNGMIDLPMMDNNGPFEINIRYAKLSPDKKFAFEVCGCGEIILEINGICDIEIEGKWKAESSISFFDNTYIQGQVQEIEFMGNRISGSIPIQSAYTLFSIGFRKQALNIIANVLEARDYLYLWVYAHHKVIYYANFLIPVLSNELLSEVSMSDKNVFPAWELNYKNLPYLDDAYVWTSIKYLRATVMTERFSKEVLELCTEILTRNYKISLFKSLAEFELLFEGFHGEKRSDIRRYLLDNIEACKPCVMNEGGDITAGYLKNELVDMIKDCSDSKLEAVTCIVYVDANYRAKNINTHETYILMPEGPISLNKIPLLENKSMVSNEATSQYFYLYYSSSTKDSKEKGEENLEMKAAIRKYFYAKFHL